MTSTDHRSGRGDTADRIARRFDSRFIQGYVRGKVRSDPVYPAVLERLASTKGPVLDLGCGVGLLGIYLRENGIDHEIVGIDFDSRKIEAGRKVVSGLTGISLRQGDARERLDFRGSVAMLDLLHYFDDDEQRRILSNAADYARPGDLVVVRDCLRDGSWRYRLTWLEETFATSIGWLRGERLNFPTRESVTAEFRRRGFEEEVIPLWGRTPFNNHLLTFRCP
jgi:SAM-dependent methyltransferase